MGENLIIKKVYSNAKIKYKRVKVCSPARLHITAMNPNKMILEKRGGGGIGIALNSNNIIEIEIIDEKEDIIEYNKKLVILHFLNIMREIFKTDVHFKIKVNLDYRLEEHIGLASNAMLSTAVVYGVNYIFGNILTKTEIVEILDNNFVEQCGDTLVKDICTGIAHNVCVLGGLCIVSENGDLIKKYDFPIDFKIFMIKTSKRNNYKSNIETEKNVVELLKMFENMYFFQKSYYILNEIMPSLNRGRMEKLFKYNREFQHYNSEENVIDYYFVNNESTRNILLELDEIENSMVGLSTNGKYIYIITENEEEVKRRCKEKGLNYTEYLTDNNGVSILEKYV